MKHYDFADKFRAVYDKAAKLYASGHRDKQGYFTSEELAFLANNGIGVQAMFDYAEDQTNYGEPGYDRALEIETIRRDYFLNAQQGKASKQSAGRTIEARHRRAASGSGAGKRCRKRPGRSRQRLVAPRALPYPSRL